jgi:hypothetical protein
MSAKTRTLILGVALGYAACHVYRNYAKPQG